MKNNIVIDQEWSSYSLPVKRKGMIKKIDLGAAMGGFAQAEDAKYVHGELSDGAQVKIRKADLFKGHTLLNYGNILDSDLRNIKDGYGYCSGTNDGSNIMGMFLAFGLSDRVFQIKADRNNLFLKCRVIFDDIPSEWKSINII